MSRVYANNQQVAILAKYMLSVNELDAKTYLKPNGYQAKINGAVYNFDYKLVQLAIDIYKSIYTKDKKSTRTKAKLPELTA